MTALLTMACVLLALAVLVAWGFAAYWRDRCADLTAEVELLRPRQRMIARSDAANGLTGGGAVPLSLPPARPAPWPDPDPGDWHAAPVENEASARSSLVLALAEAETSGWPPPTEAPWWRDYAPTDTGAQLAILAELTWPERTAVLA